MPYLVPNDAIEKMCNSDCSETETGNGLENDESTAMLRN